MARAMLFALVLATGAAAVGVITLPGTAAHDAAPPGATAQCRDGTYSFSQHHSGTCSHHGGVARWLDGDPSIGTTTPCRANPVGRPRCKSRRPLRTQPYPTR